MKESVLKSSADLTKREDKPLSACCYLLAKNRIGKERGEEAGEYPGKRGESTT